MSWTECQYCETSVLLSFQSDLSPMGGQVEGDSRALPKHPPPSFIPVPQHAIHCCRQCLTWCSKQMWAGVPCHVEQSLGFPLLLSAGSSPAKGLRNEQPWSWEQTWAMQSPGKLEETRSWAAGWMAECRAWLRVGCPHVCFLGSSLGVSGL